MSYQSCYDFFEAHGLSSRIHRFGESSATVSLAAAALGCEERYIAKTLALMAHGAPLLILMAGDARLDNQKFKYRFSAKASMMNAEQLQTYVGHEPGGVCPFGIKDGVRIYLDESLRTLPEVYPAAGTHDSAVRLTVEEMTALLPGAEWVDVAKEVPSDNG